MPPWHLPWCLAQLRGRLLGTLRLQKKLLQKALLQRALLQKVRLQMKLLQKVRRRKRRRNLLPWPPRRQMRQTAAILLCRL